jgi:hypothetical protein
MTVLKATKGLGDEYKKAAETSNCSQTLARGLSDLLHGS